MAHQTGIERECDFYYVCMCLCIMHDSSIIFIAVPCPQAIMKLLHKVYNYGWRELVRYR